MRSPLAALLAPLLLLSLDAVSAEELETRAEDMHLTMEDLMNQLNGDAAPAAEPDYDPTVGGRASAGGEDAEPVVVPWDEVYGEVSVTTPADGSVVEGAVVEVAVNINANTEDTDLFKEKYNSSVLCLSLDGSVFSCWPIWELSRYPRFANVSEGTHTVVAQITDPVTGKLDAAHQGVSSFTTVPKPPKPVEPPPPVLNADGSTNATNSTEPVQETISLPMVTVDQPAEGSAMRSQFEVRLSITTSENVTKFKRLFKYSFMCLSVDDGPHTCWPIFEDRYFPSFVGLEPGMHRLKSELSHPESGDIILGTGVGFRRFWVQEAGESLLPLQLSQPGSEFASNAIPGLEGEPAAARPQAQIVVQVAVDGFTHSLPIYDGDDWNSEAQRFCTASRLGEQCVANIVAEIGALWEARQNQHLDFKTESAAAEEEL